MSSPLSGNAAFDEITTTSSSRGSGLLFSGNEGDLQLPPPTRSAAFDETVGTALPERLSMLFPRDDDGLWPIRSNWDLRDSVARKHSLLAAIPLIGSVIGVIKLVSALAIDRENDTVEQIVVYALTGLAELLGLGILLLLLKVLYVMVKVLKEKRTATPAYREPTSLYNSREIYEGR